MPRTEYGQAIAPSPGPHDDEGTQEGDYSDAVIRNRLVVAHENYTRYSELKRSPGSTGNRVQVAELSYLLPAIEADLLLLVQDFDLELADRIARATVANRHLPGHYNNQSFSWLIEHGIDPDRLMERARELFAAEVL
jgi:hypothetical protein